MVKLQRILNYFAPLLVILNLSISALAGILAVQKYLGLNLNPLVGLPLMGVVFAIYTFNRFSDAKEDAANHGGKFLFFPKYKFFYIIGFSAFIFSSVFMIFEHFTMLKLLLAGLGILTGILYSYRIIPWYAKEQGIIFYRIKEITLVKNLFISSFWSGAIFILPILFVDGKVPKIRSFTSIYILFLSLFLLTFSSTLFGDIRDELGDRMTGINTLPVVYGKKNSYIFLGSISLTWLGFIAYFYQQNLLNFHHLIFMVLIAFYPLVYLVPYQFRLASQIITDFLCDLDLWIFSSGLVILSLN
ncbi:UbiA family prenyltransferase [Dolichospermum planctonicum CS-1226]|uniref:UbiA family prenyltransferase n=1 Tax=Dolichospermum planctonicum CS-1226 TaxID=3021751 RepID=A0ABT5AK28_9CYAN|nr:UbiA family prenyltransferase [Dolichospermum planctonicum]MDB9537655.1 UbiA family prenyltransferase [Dolichospermum planctonicum CS-1226]